MSPATINPIPSQKKSLEGPQRVALAGAVLTGSFALTLAITSVALSALGLQILPSTPVTLLMTSSIKIGAFALNPFIAASATLAILLLSVSFFLKKHQATLSSVIDSKSDPESCPEHFSARSISSQDKLLVAQVIQKLEATQNGQEAYDSLATSSFHLTQEDKQRIMASAVRIRTLNLALKHISENPEEYLGLLQQAVDKELFFEDQSAALSKKRADLSSEVSLLLASFLQALHATKELSRRESLSCSTSKSPQAATAPTSLHSLLSSSLVLSPSVSPTTFINSSQNSAKLQTPPAMTPLALGAFSSASSALKQEVTFSRVTHLSAISTRSCPPSHTPSRCSTSSPEDNLTSLLDFTLTKTPIAAKKEELEHTTADPKDLGTPLEPAVAKESSSMLSFYNSRFLDTPLTPSVSQDRTLQMVDLQPSTSSELAQKSFPLDQSISCKFPRLNDHPLQGLLSQDSLEYLLKESTPERQRGIFRLLCFIKERPLKASFNGQEAWDLVYQEVDYSPEEDFNSHGMWCLCSSFYVLAYEKWRKLQSALASNSKKAHEADEQNETIKIAFLEELAEMACALFSQTTLSSIFETPLVEEFAKDFMKKSYPTGLIEAKVKSCLHQQLNRASIPV